MRKFVLNIGIFLLGAVFAMGISANILAYLPSGSSKEVTLLQNDSRNDVVRIVAQNPVYFEEVSGFLVRPESGGPYPAIVVVHESWGLNDTIKKMSEELARKGYVVLAVDLYEGEVTSDKARAKELSDSVNRERAGENLRSAVKYLKDHWDVSQAEPIGWRFGGGQSLDLAGLNGKNSNNFVIFGIFEIQDKNLFSFEKI